MRERKRKLTEENVLQPFSFIIILFEKEKKKILSKLAAKAVTDRVVDPTAAPL